MLDMYKDDLVSEDMSFAQNNMYASFVVVQCAWQNKGTFGTGFAIDV